MELTTGPPVTRETINLNRATALSVLPFIVAICGLIAFYCVTKKAKHCIKENTGRKATNFPPCCY
jgi:hypothetical protein